MDSYAALVCSTESKDLPLILAKALRPHYAHVEIMDLTPYAHTEVRNLCLKDRRWLIEKAGMIADDQCQAVYFAGSIFSEALNFFIKQAYHYGKPMQNLISENSISARMIERWFIPASSKV